MAKQRQSADPVSAQPIKLPPVRMGFTLSGEAARLIRLASVLEDRDQSELIDELVLTHMSGYFGGRRGKKNGEVGEPDLNA
jgi:hypothetical protein